MGYSTEFIGEITIVPPLNKIEKKYLKNFSESRRVHRQKGPYYAVPSSDMGQTVLDAIDSSKPPPGQPGAWCQWVSDKTGSYLHWDGNEKFYEAEKWMVYLIEHFLKEDAYAKILAKDQFKSFQNHTLNGTIVALGEEKNDIWKIEVKNNKVYIANGKYNFPFDKKSMNEEDYENAIYDHEIDIDEIKWTFSSKKRIAYLPSTKDEKMAGSIKEKNKMNEAIILTNKKHKTVKL